jgi:hypothetical protein
MEKETTLAQLRNALGPHYSLPGMILAMDENPKMKDLITEQAKRAEENKLRIKELLSRLEEETEDCASTKKPGDIFIDKVLVENGWPDLGQYLYVLSRKENRSPVWEKILGEKISRLKWYGENKPNEEEIKSDTERFSK